MSAMFCHGFDESTTTAHYFTTSSSVTISSANPRTGANAARVASTGSVVLPSALEHATFITGVGLYVPASASAAVQFTGDADATVHVTVSVRSDGSIDVRRGTASGTVLGTASAGTFPTGAYKHLGVKATLHDTTGAVTVQVDGVSVITLTNIDTKNAGTKTVFDSIRLVSLGGNSSDFDDWYACNGAGSANNDLLGDKKVLTVVPNGDGATTDFTPSTGSSHFALVDEIPPNTSDYNESSTNGHVELYDMTDFPAGTQGISFAQLELYAAKSDAGAVMKFQRACRSGGSNFFGADMVLGTGFLYITESGKKVILETDPATAAAWTLSGINSAQMGVKLVTP